MHKVTEKTSHKAFIVASILAIILLVAFTVGTTIAYYADDAAVKNEFTVGNVYINLFEKDKDGNIYEDGITYDNVLPSILNVKEIYIQNTGENAAYTRMKLSMPKAFYNIIDLDINADNNISQWTLVQSSTYVENNIEYIAMVYNYNDILIPNEITDVLMKSVTVKAHIDNDDIDSVASLIGVDRSQLLLTIKAVGEAIQVEGFSNDMNEAWEMFETSANTTTSQH